MHAASNVVRDDESADHHHHHSGGAKHQADYAEGSSIGNFLFGQWPLQVCKTLVSK
jgi:hypothetical protein